MIERVMAVARAGTVKIRRLAPSHPNLPFLSSGLRNNSDRMFAFFDLDRPLFGGGRQFLFADFEMLSIQNRRARRAKYLVLAAVARSENLVPQGGRLKSHRCVQKDAICPREEWILAIGPT